LDFSDTAGHNGVLPEISCHSVLEIPTTVVLKHIDHANPFLQEQLARALETKKVTRLGSYTNHLALGRVIFTFREPLPSLRRKGRITDALFRRLRECEHVSIPPLRKRKEDIPLLVDHFLNQFLNDRDTPDEERAQVRHGIKVKGKIETRLLRLLQQQRWVQNVIQLKAYIRSILMLNYQESILETEKIEVLKMLLMIEEGSEFSLREVLSTIEEGIIQRALTKNAGHRTKAAQLLGINDRVYRRDRRLH
jgi:DNA-binding NtrC family response regulator